MLSWRAIVPLTAAAATAGFGAAFLVGRAASEQPWSAAPDGAGHAQLGQTIPELTSLPPMAALPYLTAPSKRSAAPSSVGSGSVSRPTAAEPAATHPRPTEPVTTEPVTTEPRSPTRTSQVTTQEDG